MARRNLVDRRCSKRFSHVTRRRFLQATGAAVGSTVWPLGAGRLWGEKKRRPKVAAVFTEFTYRSHAHVILENFLVPYLFNGRRTDPGVDVVSFYGDQFPENEMAHGVSKQFGIPIYKTIGEALRCGGKELAVDAVLSIGEHGDYPDNDLGQKMYPRKRFFDDIVAVMKQSHRFVPLYSDKHLSYRWDWAKEMYDTTEQLGIPFMAGSSVPLAQRRPPLELPRDAQIADAVSIHGGGVESYDFHGLEVLQSLVEFRKGAEQGVSEVQFLDGEDLWKAAERGEWSPELAQAAMAAELGKTPADLRELGGPPHGILIRYKDGFRATMLKLGNSGIRWNFACRLKGERSIRATQFYVGPWENRNLFKALSHAIQYHIREQHAPYPVERTLLTTGIVEAAMRSRHQGNRRLPTPHLEFAYAPRDFTAFREMGATWKIITDETPQPKGIVPVKLPQ